MKFKSNNILIISDTHDDKEALSYCINKFKNLNFDLIIHAGDITKPDVIKSLLLLNKPIIAVYGNCDKDKKSLKDAIGKNGIIGEAPLEIKINDKKFIITHDINKIDKKIKADVIVHGHTHLPEIETNHILTINPGECCGFYTFRKTCVLLDMENLEAELIEL